MISWSSCLASSAPATSSNVIFGRSPPVSSRALLFPNVKARFPPVCIWRMMKIQMPRISRIGSHAKRICVQFVPWSPTLIFAVAFFSRMRSASPSSFGGTMTLKRTYS